MKLPVKRIYQALLLLAVLLTPIFNIYELIALVNRTLVTRTDFLTPSYIKVIKDVIFFAIIFVGLNNFLINRKLAKTAVIFFFLSLAILSFVVSFVSGQAPLILLSGLRWLMPLILFLFIYNAIDKEFQEKMARLLTGLLFLGFCLQIYELFYARFWFGQYSFGLSNRNPGFYVTPSSMALFALLVIYYVYNFMKEGPLRKVNLYLIGPASVILTGSGTGILSLFIFCLLTFTYRVKQKAWVIIPSLILLCVVAIGLPAITGRNFIYKSLMQRNDIFLEVIKNSPQLISSHFGSATNTAMLANMPADKSKSMTANAFAADSTITSIIYNAGIVAAFVFFLVIIKYFGKDLIHLQLWSIYLPFIATAIIFEVFPANILLVMNFAYFYWRHNLAKRSLASTVAGEANEENID